MGSGNSHENFDYDRPALEFYESALQTCLLPDVGIDGSLLRFSGTDSNAVLQAYSMDLAAKLPGYTNALGSALGPMTSVPNAVGLGAFILSIIMEFCIATFSLGSTQMDSSSMIQRVFGQEKASDVRDTMSEYLKRHRMFIDNDQKLMEEVKTLERQLSGHLTRLRNSLLHDGQMSSRGFKIWVNGAAFHIQMLIHAARLSAQTGKQEPDFGTINRVINGFSFD
ncbi:hypothetical protein LDENG_00055580 [Lucifuga dentata]|nr:hypothetical protein LDENG_00055580 [Lucifuga dentata]